MSDFRLGHIRVEKSARDRVRDGESVTGILRPKRRGDGPKHGPAEAVFEEVDARVVETTAGPAVAPSWMVDALVAGGRSEPFEIASPQTMDSGEGK